MNWTTFFSAFGGTATALTALGALFAFLIQHRLNLHLASFNSELQRDLAKVTAELGVIAKRQEIQFSYLHNERAKVIVQLYGKLVGLLWEVEYLRGKSTFKSGTPQVEYDRRTKQVDTMYELWDEARRFFADNRLYFQRPILEKIVKLLGTFSNAPELYISATEQPREAKAEFYKLSDEINSLLNDIEEEFRTLLAVKEPWS